jgi:hypothetical protein
MDQPETDLSPDIRRRKLLLCHCGKWAFRLGSNFPIFDPGPLATPPAPGGPIDWHVAPIPR